MKSLLVGMLLAMVSVVSADTYVVIENPRNGEVMQGVGTIQGWVATTDKIVAAKYFIDGKDKGNIAFQIKRQDVENALPDFDANGFSSTYYYGLLDDDTEHTVVIQVLTDQGEVIEVGSKFGVARFDVGQTWDKAPVMGYSMYEPTDTGFILHDVVMNTVFYESIVFDWNNATQNFTIVEIQ